MDNGSQDSVQTAKSSDMIDNSFNQITTEELTNQATVYLERVSRYLTRLEDITQELRSRTGKIKEVSIPIIQAIHIPSLDLHITVDNVVIWQNKTITLGKITGELLRQIARAYPNQLSIGSLVFVIFKRNDPSLHARTTSNLHYLKQKLPGLVINNRGYYSLAQST